MNIERGTIYLADLNPTIGSEIAKIRPVVVVSNDENNRYSDIVTVLPITSSTHKIYPFEVFVPKGIAELPKDSKIKANQIRSIDKSRIKKTLGTLPPMIMKDVGRAIKIHLEY